MIKFTKKGVAYAINGNIISPDRMFNKELLNKSIDEMFEEVFKKEYKKVPDYMAASINKIDNAIKITFELLDDIDGGGENGK